MAKTYLGGHTVVGADSGWFTGVNHKPVGDDAKPWVPKKPKPAPVAKASPTTAQSAIVGLDSLRLSYIHIVLDACFQKRPIPNPPKKIRTTIDAQINRAGGPLRWARAQPEFLKIIVKKRKKYGGDLPANPPKAGEVNTVPVSLVPPSTRIAILKADYERLEARRDAAMNTIRECDRQLSAIDGELKKLGAT